MVKYSMVDGYVKNLLIYRINTAENKAAGLDILPIMAGGCNKYRYECNKTRVLLHLYYIFVNSLDISLWWWYNSIVA